MMTAGVSELEAVTVDADRYSSEGVSASSRTGTTILSAKDINAIPVVGGEAELLRTIQLLPGTVHATTEVKPKINFEKVEAELFYNGFNDTLAQITCTFRHPPEKNW